MSRNPTYHSIGDHTESVQIDFNPEKVSFRQLMENYAASPGVHQPTWNRQYRNAIFWHNPQQRLTAQEVLGQVRDCHVDVEPFRDFTRAEDYHQKYALQNSSVMADLAGKFEDFRHFVDSTAAARVNGYLSGYGDPAIVRGQIGKLGLTDKSQEQLLQRLASPGARCR